MLTCYAFDLRVPQSNALNNNFQQWHDIGPRFNEYQCVHRIYKYILIYSVSQHCIVPRTCTTTLVQPHACAYTGYTLNLHRLYVGAHRYTWVYTGVHRYTLLYMVVHRYTPGIHGCTQVHIGIRGCTPVHTGYIQYMGVHRYTQYKHGCTSVQLLNTWACIAQTYFTGIPGMHGTIH